MPSQTLCSKCFLYFQNLPGGRRLVTVKQETVARALISEGFEGTAVLIAITGIAPQGGSYLYPLR